MEAGFRETGAVSVQPKTISSFSSSHTPPSSSSQQDSPQQTATPIVAVRSMGLSFESLVGFESGDGSSRRPLVSVEYLGLLVRIANERFKENEKRIARFQTALEGAMAAAELEHGTDGSNKRQKKQKEKGGEEWEDAEARRERKRQEGLAKKEAAAAVRKAQEGKEEKEAGGEPENGRGNGLSLKELVLQEPDVL